MSSVLVTFPALKKSKAGDGVRGRRAQRAADDSEVGFALCECTPVGQWPGKPSPPHGWPMSYVPPLHSGTLQYCHIIVSK